MKRTLLLFTYLLAALAGRTQTGSALDFDGVDDYVTFSTTGKPDYTVEARIMFTGSSTANQSIVVYTNGNAITTYSNQIRTDGSGHFVNYTYDGGLKVVTGTTVAALNTWYHVTITGKTGDSLRLFVNGVEEGTALAASDIWQGGGYYFIGAESGGGYGYFKGQMDEVRLWSCALSATAVANGVGCSPAGPQPSLLRLYKFNQGTAGSSNTSLTTIPDASGGTVLAYCTGFAMSGSTSNWVAPSGALSTTCSLVALPEMDVRGGGFSIESGRGYSSTTDNTNFGSAVVGATRRFKIFNLGNTALTIGALSLSDTSFVITAQPAATIAPGDSTAFTVKYQNTAPGWHNATLHISNNDCDESDYSIRLEGDTDPAGAIDFDGTDDYMALPANPVAGAAAMSFEAWILWRGGNAGQHIFDFGSSATQSVYLTTSNSTNGKLRFVMASGASDQVLDGNTLSINSWHHIAVTATETGTWTMYMDGTQVAKASGYTNAIPAGGTNNWIGKSQTGSDPYFNGRIDDVRIWRRALCLTEIQNNKNCELYNTYYQNSLAGYYSFDQGASNGINNNDTVVFEHSRNGANARLRNFALNGNSVSNWISGYLTNGASCLYYSPADVNDSTETVTQYVSSTTYFNACGAIAQIAPTGTAPASGDVSVKVTRLNAVPSYTSHAYVQRMYNITPAANPATSSMTITLFFSQQEFDNYNAANGSDPDLPANSADANGISHIRITQYKGAGTVPGTYSGATATITPSNVSNSGNRWAVTFPATGQGGFTLSGLSAGTALPVKLVSFNAHAAAGKTILLSWDVAEQEDITRYVVERSSDGYTFNEAAVVAPASGKTQYAVEDGAAYTGRSYYRLRLDANRMVSYSEVKTVQLQQDAVELRISPVPARRSITVQFSDPALLHTTAVISDLQGRAVKTVMLDAYSQDIAVDELQPGVYILSTKDGKVVRLMKQ